MMVSENIRMALRSMASSKLRTFLSLLGIVIGVASVVAIMNLGQSAAESMSASFDVGGLNMITVRPRGRGRETMIFTEDFSYTLQNEIDGVQEVLPLVSSTANVRQRDEIAESVVVQGVTSGYFASNSLEAENGRLFSVEDNISRRQVAVIGTALAEDLFPAGNAVGSYVSVMRNQSKSFLVVGVLASHDTSQGSSFDDALFMPYNTYTERFRRTDRVGSYSIKVKDGYDAVSVAEDIEDYLDRVAGNDYYRLFSPATVKAMADEVTGTFTVFLAAIAAISLAVGGIGIMNIMLVSVSERTGEIGIRKALGAAPSVIRKQFLSESVVVSASGGLIGLILGIIISVAGALISDWIPVISSGAVTVAVGFPILIGIFFGWYPAAKAASLQPMEALQRE